MLTPTTYFDMQINSVDQDKNCFPMRRNLVVLALGFICLDVRLWLGGRLILVVRIFYFGWVDFVE